MKTKFFTIALLHVVFISFALASTTANEKIHKSKSKPGWFSLSPTDKEEDGTLLYPYIYNTVRSDLEAIKALDPKILAPLIAKTDALELSAQEECLQAIFGRFLRGSARLKEYSRVLTEAQLNQEGLGLRFEWINAGQVRALVGLTDLWLKEHPIPRERREELCHFSAKFFAEFDRQMAKKRAFELSGK